MRNIHFAKMTGPDDMYEVYVDRKNLGMVWKADAMWHADRFSTASPTIHGVDRDTAARKLIESQTEV